MKLYEVEKNDVLIIGAGGAGTRAAIACAERGVKATLLTKGLFGKSGITIVGFGGLGGNFDRPGDSPEIHLQDIVRSGKFMCDQDVASVMAEECQEAIRYCERLGVKYWKTDGEYQLFLLPGFTVPRCLNIYGGGYALLRSLKKKAKQYTAPPPLIDVQEDIVISRILVKDNRAYGAIGLDVREGLIRVYHCKALILDLRQ